jgi:ribonuclease HI
METILLTKEKMTQRWGHTLEGTYNTITVPKTALFGQVVHVLSEISVLAGENTVNVASPLFMRGSLQHLQFAFPNLKLVPVNDSGMQRLFFRKLEHIKNPSTAPQRKNQDRTLYICSDASKSAKHDRCGWAWYSTNAGEATRFNFGITEQSSTMRAELEGILKAITENKDSEYKKIHVYCDSQRSVELAKHILETSDSQLNIGRLEPRVQVMAFEARRIASFKNVTVSWVKGHRKHRLNVAADYLSREARLATEKFTKLPRTAPQVEVLNLFFND